jgi:hypothetical protein
VSDFDRPTLEIDKGNIMEYVGGPHPYLWIGKPDGTYLASVDIDPLKDFIGPLRRARKEKAPA